MALVGAEARLVEVELRVSTGVPGFRVVGLPATSVREAEQRTRSAIESSGEKWPGSKIVANLAPGALRKEGTHFDVAIGLGVMAAHRRLRAETLDGWVILGELALDGTVRSVRGVLPAAIACKEADLKGIVCPVANAPEAAAIGGVTVVPIDTFRHALDFFLGRWVPDEIELSIAQVESVEPDICEVRDQDAAKDALEVAAAGGHNLLMCGPPGSGKTMLARRLPSILPRMTAEESLEVTKIHSVAGLLPERASLITQRPFRSPHHHISMAGLIGGGAHLAHPGEVSLAHHGCLFLDELSLYRRDVLDALRAPIERGRVRIARSGGSVVFPCRFSLIAAMNPCPCGYLNDSVRTCTCDVIDLRRHGRKTSGPFLDRIDMQVELHRVSKDALMKGPEREGSTTVRERVESARALQSLRYGSPLITNASAPMKAVERSMQMTRSTESEVRALIDSMALSARGFTRMLRIARTIADLGAEETVTTEHLGRALSFRLSDGVSGAVA